NVPAALEYIALGWVVQQHDLLTSGDPLKVGLGVVNVLLLVYPVAIGVTEGLAAVSLESTARGEGELLSAARAARDAEASEVGATRATVTAGYRLDTGEIAAGCSGPGCAEDAVVRALGGNSRNIRFTEAIRPRTGQEVPICLACQAKYSPDQF